LDSETERKTGIITVKEKFEIVIGAAEPRFAGAFPRRRRRRKPSKLFQK
jgi:hypothetical protein